MNDQTRDYIREHRHLTAAEISAAIAADPRFARSITADDLRGLFGEQPAIPFKLKAAVANEAVPAELRAGIDRLLDTAGYENGFATTETAGVAAQVRGMAAACVSLGILTAEEVELLFDLAGGPLLARLTAAEVQTELDRLERTEALTEILAQLRGRSGQIMLETQERHQGVIARVESALADAEVGLEVQVPEAAALLAELEG